MIWCTIAQNAYNRVSANQSADWVQFDSGKGVDADSNVYPITRRLSTPLFSSAILTVHQFEAWFWYQLCVKKVCMLRCFLVMVSTVKRKTRSPTPICNRITASHPRHRPIAQAPPAQSKFRVELYASCDVAPQNLRLLHASPVEFRNIHWNPSWSGFKTYSCRCTMEFATLT